MSLPMDDLIIPWSERFVVEDKINLLYEKKSHMFKIMRHGNAPEMALLAITFECMSYQALNLYCMCCADFTF